jgi:hypothetical protein
VAGRIAQNVLDALNSGDYEDIPGDLIAAPALLTNGVLNGAILETSIFGPVAIPGILSDATLLDPEGTGPISLAIELAHFVRGLLAPPANASTLTTQEPQRIRIFEDNLRQSTPTDGAHFALPSRAKSSADVLEAKEQRDATDKVTNADADGSSSANESDRVQMSSITPRNSESVAGATGLKNFGQGVRDGIQGLRQGVRNVVKSLEVRGEDATEREAPRTQATLPDRVVAERGDAFMRTSP